MSDNRISSTPMPQLGKDYAYNIYNATDKVGGITRSISPKGNPGEGLTIHEQGNIHFHGTWGPAWEDQKMKMIGNSLPTLPPFPSFPPPPKL